MQRTSPLCPSYVGFGTDSPAAKGSAGPGGGTEPRPGCTGWGVRIPSYRRCRSPMSAVRVRPSVRTARNDEPETAVVRRTAGGGNTPPHRPPLPTQPGLPQDCAPPEGERQSSAQDRTLHVVAEADLLHQAVQFAALLLGGTSRAPVAEDEEGPCGVRSFSSSSGGVVSRQ